MHNRFLILVGGVAMLVAGCDLAEQEPPLTEAAPQPTEIKQQDPPETPTRPSDHIDPEELELDKSVEAIAVRKVISAIDGSLELGPTTVVWLLDATESNSNLNRIACNVLISWYRRRESKETKNDLQTAVATFADKTVWLTDETTTSADDVVSAIQGIRIDTAVTENTFAAASDALERYREDRTAEARQVIVVIVSDEAGDDTEKVDDVAATASRLNIPFYIIGSPAPFGKTTVIKRPHEKHADGTPAVIHGPETRYAMHVNIPLAGSYWGADKIDSGYGPFALEYLARASGGQFLAVRPDADDGVVRGLRELWPDSDVVQFPDVVMSRYRPDYVSADKADRLIETNAVCSALVQAAKTEEVETLEFPKLEFGKRNEAQLIRDLTDAQKAAAKMTPPLERLVETLQPSATENAAPSKRWQASFDLAYARALAAKTRVEGYNLALAELKRSSAFQQPGSSRWVLQTSMEAADNSALQRAAAKSKELLTGLIRDHADTPWAYLAKKELAVPIGWRWTEQ